ncbi:hypothetical protein KFL_000290470 [Klebsormidium nitens]|uniref:S-acyltransferase n=1 Tax=Klebsormidium nitens TaxID=105231 RepID=A0A1Y1HS63_KLENI|nr:hypothetical protein KFL_000290470 [Klebsormidium nitens]|eukprot:GAQ79397.1 hypothetical protein KFL_000290470 [Klebsormidium nitens]
MAGSSYARQVVDALSPRTPPPLQASSPRSMRHQEVVSSAWSARLCWLALHSAAIGVVCVVDSDLSRSWREGNYWFLGSYLLLLSATVSSYLYVCGSSPGYVDEVMKEVRTWGPPEDSPLSPRRSLVLQRAGGSGQFRDSRTPTRHASLLNLSEVPSMYDTARLGIMSPQPAKRGLAQGEAVVRTSSEPRESRRAPRGDTVTELLCDGACANGHSGRDLEKGAPNLADRTLAFKKPGEMVVNISGARLVPGGAEAGERSPLLGKSRSTGRLEENGGTSTPKSPSLSRYNSGKRCTYCGVWQPLRTKHCHECDRCVLRFDHHCFWVGTCVGYRNHRRFWWYLFFQSCLGVWTVAINVSALDWNDQTEGWFSLNVFMILDTITLICFLIFLVALLVFHGYLAATDQTTYETTRRKRIAYLRPLPDNVSPFSKGCATNLARFCCASTSNVPVYELPSLDELRERSVTSTWLENDYYSCC